MTKKLILASLIGLTAVAASAPTFAATSTNPWVRKLEELGVKPNPYMLPSYQLHIIQERRND